MPISPTPLEAERIAVVRLVDEDHLDIVDVGVHRHMIFGDVGIHDAAEPVIDQRLLVQRHADAPDHAAQDLAARGLGVQDAPGRNRADGARDADRRRAARPPSPRQRSAACVLCARAWSSAGVGGFLLLDAVHGAVPHGIGD